MPSGLGDGYAKVYVFRTEFGDEVREIVPPPSWTPLKATADELQTYGFPPRPSNADELSAWTNRMARWKGAGVLGMCETSKRSGLVTTQPSTNWAGGMTVNGTTSTNTFQSSDGEWNQPAFVAACPAASGYSIWSGLGGWNQHRLVQSGVDVVNQALNSNYMFWEVISPQHDSHEVMWSGTTVNPGDDVESFVKYSGGTVLLAVTDYTSGVSHNASMSTYAGQAMSQYWDGSTADFITEAPTGGSAPGGLYYLRKPSLGQTYYYFALANSQAIAAFSTWGLIEVGPSGTTMQTTSFNGANAWYDNWKSCS